MAITNYERVGKAMELLKAGLAPFVEREFKNLYKGQALVEAQRFMSSERLEANRPVHGLGCCSAPAANVGRLE